MNAILLVGGLGTRLRPLTLDRPKALLPVLNTPFLAYQFDILRTARVKDVMIAAGPGMGRWEKKFRAIKPAGFRLHFSYEKTRLGTGGAIRFAFDRLKKKAAHPDEPVLVFNGDVFFDLDASRFLAYHRSKKSQCTIALTRVQDPSRYGVVDTRAGGAITRFLEKPKNYRKPAYINAGAYVMEPALINAIPAGREISVERETFPALLQKKMPAFGYRLAGYWNDIGTHATYLQAHTDLLTKRNRWTGTEFLRKRAARVVAGKSVKTGRRVTLEGTVCLGPGVRIEDDVRISNSVIHENTFIGAGSTVESAIVGAQCRIGRYTVVKPGTVLGPKTNK